MDKLRIHGGQRLRGRVAIGGAKNAALPALAAGLLTGERVVLRHVPRVRDVRTMMRVLEQLGADVDESEGTVALRLERLASHEAPYDLVKTMRASILVLGPLLARFGRARVSLPGGCAIGERPVNYHLEALSLMGARIELDHGYIEATADGLAGATIDLPGKTVTGTENLMMAAALARGTTVLRNCAQEPEVVDLARLLERMGASIHGAGSDEILIEGRPELGGAEHDVIADRIEAGTYLIAGALAGDGLELTGSRPEHLEPVLQQLRLVGVPVTAEADVLRVSAPERLGAHDLRTAPSPGFPTDMQAQYLALMTQAQGTSVITETVFERRFMHVGELLRMGADIRIDGRSCVVVGPSRLTGAQVMATDLRASASLVLAGLVADGITVIDRVYHLDRGYEAMERKLRDLGAEIERIPMSEDCLFCKIAAGKIPSKAVYSDDEVLAFHDIQPQAPVHVLIIPRRHIASLDECETVDEALLGKMLSTASKLAAELGVAGGYRVVNNCGASAGQSVFHIHLHLLGGRSLGWPPG